MIGSNGHVDAVIRIRDVSVSFGSKRVLENINLDVYRNEVLVLLGGSGSGKTTLLKQVLGLMKPDEGSILVNGVDITSCTPAQLDAVRRKMGAAFQAAALFDSLSIDENVALPLREMTKIADSTIKLIAWIKLWSVGLAEAGPLYPNELSGGMRKRAAIARAIALDPEILVFDEPSAGLDPIVAAGLDKLILFLKEDLGITIVVVTHVLESAFRIADRLAMLYQGRLIAVDRKEQFLANTHPRLRQFLEGKPDPGPGGEQGFMVSYLRQFEHEH
jgi:phospholipid/cholesterol/gamma-HCH transport system ATP-binding protein